MCDGTTKPGLPHHKLFKHHIEHNRQGKKSFGLVVRKLSHSAGPPESAQSVVSSLVTITKRRPPYSKGEQDFD